MTTYDFAMLLQFKPERVVQFTRIDPTGTTHLPREIGEVIGTLGEVSPNVVLIDYDNAVVLIRLPEPSDWSSTAEITTLLLDHRKRPMNVT